MAALTWRSGRCLPGRPSRFSYAPIQERLYALAHAQPTLPTSHGCGSGSSICGPLSPSCAAGKPSPSCDHPPIIDRSLALAAESSGRRPSRAAGSGLSGEFPRGLREPGQRPGRAAAHSRSGIAAAGGRLCWPVAALRRFRRRRRSRRSCSGESAGGIVVAGSGGLAVTQPGSGQARRSKARQARRRQALFVLTRCCFDPVDPGPIDPAAHGKTRPCSGRVVRALGWYGRCLLSYRPRYSLDTRSCLPGGLLSFRRSIHACQDFHPLAATGSDTKPQVAQPHKAYQRGVPLHGPVGDGGGEGQGP